MKKFILIVSILSMQVLAGNNAANAILTINKSLEEKSKDKAHQFLNMLQNAPHGKSCHKCPIAQEFSNKEPSSQDQLGSKGEMLVFISFSLGATTLKQLYKDVQKIGGRLILRGLYQDSFRLTQQKIKELKIVVDIDPTLFEKFNIKQVPTFIVTEPYQTNQPFKYDQLAGNVTLSYTLEKFSEEGEIIEAGSLLNKLKEKTHA